MIGQTHRNLKVAYFPPILIFIHNFLMKNFTNNWECKWIIERVKKATLLRQFVRILH